LDTSIAVVYGNPAITYVCASLNYLRATTSTGDNALDWQSIVLDPEPIGACSLAVVGGNPAIAFCGYDSQYDHELQYIRSTTNTGMATEDWSQFLTIDDSSPNTGISAIMDVAYGGPAIAYVDAVNWHLNYAGATGSSGSEQGDWNAMETVVSEDLSATGGFSMAIVDGNPAIVMWKSQHVTYAYHLP